MRWQPTDAREIKLFALHRFLDRSDDGLVDAAESAIVHAQVEAGFFWFDTRQQ
jgi:hypothetical protein